MTVSAWTLLGAICGASLLGGTIAAGEAARGLRKLEVPIANGPAMVYTQSQALVIGCSDYQAWPKLNGVREDVPAVEAALTRQGFQVATLMNPTLAQLRQGIEDFIAQQGMLPDNRLVLYFAGHGYTATLGDGRQMGYIVPVDAPDPAKDAVAFRSRALDMRSIEGLAERIESRHALFAFDSCFSGSLFALRASTEPPAVVAEALAKPVRQFLTSGSAGEQVPDQSVFRRLFVRGLDGEADLSGDGWITGTELGAYLFTRTTAETRGQQNPQTGKIRNLDLNQGDVVFATAKGKGPIASWAGKVGGTAPVAPAPVVTKPPAGPKPGDELPPPGSADSPFRVKVVLRDGTERIGIFDPLKRQMEIEMKGAKAIIRCDPRDVVRWEVPPPLVPPAAAPGASGGVAAATDAPASGRQPAPPAPWADATGNDQYGSWADFPIGGFAQRFRWIPPGKFQMGSPKTEAGRDDDEALHNVTLTKGFWMADSECTLGQWRGVTGERSKLDDPIGMPVTNISKQDFIIFFMAANKALAAKSIVVRLPTEAEWEYACRAGTRGPYSCGNGELQLAKSAWFRTNSGDRGREPRQLAPNAWGLFDMHGNVWETCQDIYSDYREKEAVDPLNDGFGDRVCRGGAYNSYDVDDLRSANRAKIYEYGESTTGMRLVISDK